jgi:nitrate reductase gamma subunit
MTETELLTWLRGPGFTIALSVFIGGLLFRVVQNLVVGRSRELAAAKGSRMKHGLVTIWRRSFFHPFMTHRGYFTLIAGYIFHLGFLITLLLLSQHIVMFKNVLGFGWPALPPTVIDITALLSIAALFAILIHRIMDPVLKQISDYQDYLAWFLTLFPLATGFLVMNPVGIAYKWILAMHILSAEVLLIGIPFTKLSHMLSIFISRWYNGAIAGYKGIQS